MGQTSLPRCQPLCFEKWVLDASWSRVQKAKRLRVLAVTEHAIRWFNSSATRVRLFIEITTRKGGRQQRMTWHQGTTQLLPIHMVSLRSIDKVLKRRVLQQTEYPACVALSDKLAEYVAHHSAELFDPFCHHHDDPQAPPPLQGCSYNLALTTNITKHQYHSSTAQLLIIRFVIMNMRLFREAAFYMLYKHYQKSETLDPPSSS